MSCSAKHAVLVLQPMPHAAMSACWEAARCSSDSVQHASPLTCCKSCQCLKELKLKPVLHWPAGHHRHANSTSQASAIAAYAQYHALNSVPENLSSERTMSSLLPSPATSQMLDTAPSEPTSLADALHGSTGRMCLQRRSGHDCP